MKTALAALVAACLAVPALAAESSGTITISISEYDALKKANEAKESEQYWNMTFQQILDKEHGDAVKAWGLYDYWVLRRVYLDRQVDGSSVAKIIDDFRILNQISDKPITLVISSPGGSVFDGLNLYNAMMASPAPVNTVCDGMAASMAAVILSAGDHRTANAGCMFLVHEVAGGGGGGNTTERIKVADAFISIENALLQILSENSGLSANDILTLGQFESWWNAEETLALGFVDEVSGGKPREMAPGSRSIPNGLLPKERITRHVVERFAE